MQHELKLPFITSLWALVALDLSGRLPGHAGGLGRLASVE